MNLRLIPVVFVTVFLFSRQQAIAQVQHDLQSWTGLELNRELPKKFSTSATVQLRTFNNLSMLRQLYGQLKISWKMNKYITISAGSRYIYTETINAIRIFNDWTGTYSFKLDGIGLEKFKIQLGLRLRFQDQISNIPGNAFTFRPKFKAQLIHKKWKVIPWLAWENYFGKEYDGIERGRMRLSAGADLDMKKRFLLSLGYIYQKPVNVSEPVNAHIFSIMLSYDWKAKKKK